MVGVCCGCIAQPASVQPRKTYNNLVGQLFAGEPIKTSDSLDTSLRRKIQKLQEYVQKNPAKIPKVSRRLMRRVRQTLRRPGDNLGHVKVAVYAWIYMLAMSADEDSSYSPSFFASEIVSGPDAVVPVLLKDAHIEVRTLGAELLCAFTAVQGESDTKLADIQKMTPLACRAARAALHAESADHKVTEAAERRRAGDVLAVPNPLDLISRRAPAHVAALEASCLRCLCEVVALAARSKVAPDHMEQMQAVALDNLRREVDADGSVARGSEAGDGASVAAASAGPATGTAASTCATRSAAPTSVCASGTTAAALAGGSQPAGSVVDPEFCAAMGVAHRVPGGGGAHDLAARLLQLLVDFVGDISTVYDVMGTFYRYMDAKQRWGEQRIIQAFTSAIFSSGTQHHFPIFSSMLRHASSRALAPPDCAAVVGLASQQAKKLEAAHVMPALAAALQELPRAWASQAHAAAAGGASSGEAAPALALAALGLGGPSAGANGGAEQQQAAASVTALREAMLGLVRQLAVKVGSAAELAEALSVALRAAAKAAGSDDTAAATMGVEGTWQAAAAWAGGSAGEAAAGTEQPRQPLPGGVLPPSLVAAVLGLEEGPKRLHAAARWPLLRVLVRLLPVAPQGLRADKQAAALAATVCRALFAQDPAAWQGCGPQDLAGADRLLRACLSGPAPRPAAQVQAARRLLHAARGWGDQEASWGAAGGGDARVACAVVQVFDSAAGALAAASGAGEALPRLELSPEASASLLLSPRGLIAPSSAASFDQRSAPACEAALDALAHQQTPASWAEAAQSALSRAPALTAEYQDSLEDLLGQAPVDGGRQAGSSDSDGKQPFADRVNALFTRRMITLRRELAHVSEIMRDSFVPRMSDAGGPGGPPAAAIASSDTCSAGGASATTAAIEPAALLRSLPELPADGPAAPPPLASIDDEVSGAATAAATPQPRPPQPPSAEPALPLPPAASWGGPDGEAAAAAAPHKGGKSAALNGGDGWDGAAAAAAKVSAAADGGDGADGADPTDVELVLQSSLSAGGGRGRAGSSLLAPDEVKIGAVAGELEPMRPAWR